jgi:hypothetical protein
LPQASLLSAAAPESLNPPLLQLDAAMKLADIPPGSDLAYRCAAKLIAEQVEFELETCRRLFGTEPERVLELLAKTPDWTVFFEEEDVAPDAPVPPFKP